MADVIVREAARILVLSNEGQVLLFRVENLPGQVSRRLWITPGGGIDPGESPGEAAVRELWEETGLRVATLGDCVWVRDFPFVYRDRQFVQREQYFVYRTDRFEPSRDNFVEGEDRFLQEHRWWSVPEICASTDYFAPKSIGALLPAVIDGTLPELPFRCPD